MLYWWKYRWWKYRIIENLIPPKWFLNPYQNTNTENIEALIWKSRYRNSSYRTYLSQIPYWTSTICDQAWKAMLNAYKRDRTSSKCIHISLEVALTLVSEFDCTIRVMSKHQISQQLPHKLLSQTMSPVRLHCWWEVTAVSMRMMMYEVLFNSF